MYVIFLSHHFSYTIMFLDSFIHAIAWISISFIFNAKPYSISWTCCSLFLHSPVDEHLDYVCLLALRSNLIWIFTYKSLSGCIFYSFGWIPRRRIAGFTVSLCLTSQEMPKTLSQCGCYFIFMPTIYEDSNFSTFSSTLVFVCLFDYSYPVG